MTTIKLKHQPRTNLYRVDPDRNRLELFSRGCRTGNISAVRSCLADSSFDPNEHTYSGESDGYSERIMSSGFIEACYNGHTEIVTLLLEDSRIDVNKGDNDGTTGFIYACSNGQREIVSLLLEDSRIDVNKEDNTG